MANILFLAMFLLIPIAMIVSIIILIVRSIRRIRGLKAFFVKRGWIYRPSGKGTELNKLLGDYFFPIRKGKHSLRNLFQSGKDFPKAWITDYHYQSPGNSGRRRGGDYSIAVSERKGGVESAWMIPRQSGPLSYLAEAAASGTLFTPDDPSWSWLLVSSIDHFESLKLTKEHSEALKKVLNQGDAFFLLPGLIVLSRHGHLTHHKAEKLLSDLEAVRLAFPNYFS